MLFHEICEFVQDDGADSANAVFAPHGVECLLCGSDGDVDVFCGGLRDLGEDLAGSCSKLISECSMDDITFDRTWVNHTAKIMRQCDIEDKWAGLLDGSLIRAIDELAVDEEADFEG